MTSTYWCVFPGFSCFPPNHFYIGVPWPPWCQLLTSAKLRSRSLGLETTSASVPSDPDCLKKCVWLVGWLVGKQETQYGYVGQVGWLTRLASSGQVGCLVRSFICRKHLLWEMLNPNVHNSGESTYHPQIIICEACELAGHEFPNSLMALHHGVTVWTRNGF